MEGVRNDLTGQVFNNLTVISHAYTRKRKSYWNVECTCGKVYCTRSDVLKVNKVGCGNCYNTFTEQKGIVTVDISTEKFPQTFCKVLSEDWENLRYFRWYAKSQGDSPIVYAATGVGSKELLMHRIISDCPKGKIVDHINGNGLDNTITNLRITDKKGNATNAKRPVTNCTGVVGVSRTAAGTFRAYIVVDDKQISLGTHKSLEKARVARKEAEVLYNFHENHGRDRSGLGV